MAACHTENTSCYLSGSAPRRQGLEQALMAVVSEKGVNNTVNLLAVVSLFVWAWNWKLLCPPVRVVQEIERPLAQALEGWILQQAVTGLMVGGKLEQAEALCSQVGWKSADAVGREERHINTSVLRVQLQLTLHLCLHMSNIDIFVMDNNQSY